jgi:hypothetical protein
MSAHHAQFNNPRSLLPGDSRKQAAEYHCPFGVNQWLTIARCPDYVKEDLVPHVVEWAPCPVIVVLQ